jgi:hypothetical protein
MSPRALKHGRLGAASGEGVEIASSLSEAAVKAVDNALLRDPLSGKLRVPPWRARPVAYLRDCGGPASGRSGSGLPFWVFTVVLAGIT